MSSSPEAPKRPNPPERCDKCPAVSMRLLQFDTGAQQREAVVEYMEELNTTYEALSQVVPEIIELNDDIVFAEGLEGKVQKPSQKDLSTIALTSVIVQLDQEMVALANNINTITADCRGPVVLTGRGEDGTYLEGRVCQSPNNEVVLADGAGARVSDVVNEEKPALDIISITRTRLSGHGEDDITFEDI